MLPSWSPDMSSVELLESTLIKLLHFAGLEDVLQDIRHPLYVLRYISVYMNTRTYPYVSVCLCKYIILILASNKADEILMFLNHYSCTVFREGKLFQLKYVSFNVLMQTHDLNIYLYYTLQVTLPFCWLKILRKMIGSLYRSRK